MQGRIQADTDIVFVMSTGPKNSIVTELEDKKGQPDFLKIRERGGGVGKKYILARVGPEAGEGALQGVDLDLSE
jgi:hypothetical protein